jgi:UDP-N-acetylglucosamine 2-epimerase
LKYVKVVVGNSSSGIIEVPFFNIPTVNIGDRQSGRLHADSVINTATNVKSIITGIEKALSPAFRTACSTTSNPYGEGKTTPAIIKAIMEAGKLKSTKKTFYDLQ